MLKNALKAKTCKDCGVLKGPEDFSVRNTGTLYSYCKPCNVERARQWGLKNSERRSENLKRWNRENHEAKREYGRRAHYRIRYGIEYEIVLAMLEEQSSRCAICETGITQDTLYVDHCHETSIVRGLLCNRCNISLAPLEKAEWLTKAQAYLESHRSRS